MIWATQFCCFAFFTMAFSPLAGAAFWGAYALINYVKKMGDTPTQAPQDPQQMEIPLPKEKKEENPHKQRWEQYEQKEEHKEEKPFTDTFPFLILLISIVALLAYLFFLILNQ